MLNDRELKEKYKLLEDKGNLVVLDDIWRNTGSKILLTTRNKEVTLYKKKTSRLGVFDRGIELGIICKKAFLWKNIASISSSSSYPPKIEAEKKEKLGTKQLHVI
ncbi:hypothetical protein NE237_011897 [Protea cynaroides]|uniref:NB-ARC domain-containing protein n=1 Tax=Protea cynaroides TaxID=273540 RepID=A0A9Q0JWA3_9MAGN|nr:hypothetical protein NE237_011897 [Protea cynaroides]